MPWHTPKKCAPHCCEEPCLLPVVTCYYDEESELIIYEITGATSARIVKTCPYGVVTTTPIEPVSGTIAWTDYDCSYCIEVDNECGTDSCCPACPYPTCTLTGTRSGDNIILTWSTSTVFNARAELTDKFNRVLSTLTGPGRTLTVPYGLCNGPFKLTVINDCPGSLPSVCTWSPTLNPNCDCQLCPGEITTLPTVRPSEVCVPCGCARGQGTAVALTISGVTDIQIGPDLNQVWLNPGPAGFPAGCRLAFPDCPIGPISYDRPHYTHFNGFSQLNGTWLFNLGGNQCEACGAFKCSISPEFYKFTATIEEVNSNLSTLPPCQPGLILTHTVTTMEIAIGVGINNAVRPTPRTLVDCASLGGGPGVFYRVISYVRNGAPFGTFPNAPWKRFTNTQLVTETAADPCGYRQVGLNFPVVATNGVCTIDRNGAITYPFQGGPFVGGLGDNGWVEGDFSAGFLSFGTVFESAYTTTGWP